MRFLLHVKSPRANRPYVYDTLRGTFSGPFFRRPPVVRAEEREPLLEIVLGHDCNSSCAYCDQAAIRRGRPAAPRRAPRDVDRFTACLRRLLDRDMPHDRLTCVLWGGEGLLHFEEIRRIYAGFAGFRAMRWIIPTNARLLRGRVFDWIRRRPDIHVQVSHDGLHTREFRGYDPLEDGEVLRNLFALRGEGRLVFNSVLHGRTVSREDTARYIEERMGGPCLFGDMKFIYPASDEIRARFSISDENLRAFQKRELALLFRDENYPRRNFIRRIMGNIARSLNRPFVLGYHRDTRLDRHLVAHLDGALTWAHSQSPEQSLGENEGCAYGSLWTLDKKPLTPPLAVAELFGERCAACPILAFGDRGCVCMPQYGRAHLDYYCRTQRARLLPVFSRFFFDMTGAFITSIKPLEEGRRPHA